MYKEEQDQGGTVDPNRLFAKFFAPMETLRDGCGIELIDDAWFTQAPDSPEIAQVVQRLNENLVARKRWPKGRNSASHDAMVVLWIVRERQRGKNNAWLITRDTSFCDSSWITESPRPVAITLDALLQWVSPMIQEESTAFETSYAEAVKYLLLPQENLFELKDFLIFAEMEWDTKELPAEDVEECIRFLKTTLPKIDASTPAGRETLCHQVKKFFIDPGRKHKTEITRLESEKQALKNEYDQRIAAMQAEGERRVAKIMDGTEQQLATLQQQISALEAEKNRQINALQQRLEEIEKADCQAQLKTSAIHRFIIAVAVVIGTMAGTLFCVNKWGNGGNLFQKAIASWGILAAAFALSIIASKFIIGAARLRALGWPFSKEKGQDK
jgi:uncharacterized small protein (DUF1192 family)